jgi:ABC-2 type transport system permease protein
VTRLFVVEARRVLARRVVRLFALLILAGILIAGVIVFFRSDRPGPEQQAAEEAEELKLEQACLRGEIGPPPPGEDLEEFCRSVDFVTYPDPPFGYTHVRNVVQGTTVPLVMLAWVIAASFVGADWHTGTMATTLTWEPRRLRLHSMKALAVLAILFLGFVAVQVVLGLALLPAAAFRGTTEGADAAWLRDTSGVVLRGGFLAVVAGALGFSLASVARNTAAGVGIGFGYVVIAENLLGALLPGLVRWLLVPNAIVFMVGADFDVSLDRTPGEAAALLAAYAAVALVAATAVFRARDVT